MHRAFFLTITIICNLLITSSAHAIAETYVSRPDQDLQIEKWAAVPLVDNTQNIYATPLTEALNQYLTAQTEFEFSTINDIQTNPESLEEKPQQVKKILQDKTIDALWAGRISKGPAGITLRLVLFSGKDGLPLISETKNAIKLFDTRELSRELIQLASSIKSKLPYKGRILSRRGQQVTLNLGKSSGLQVGQEIESIQILKIQRHPRFRFVINLEKEIMGKIKITKVDDRLSFGSILSERTEGQLQIGAKVNFDQFVEYPGPAQLKDGSLVDGIKNREDSDVAFGDDPKEWKPLGAPTFGQVALLFGFGSYRISTSPTSGSGLSSQNNLTPSFHVESEMWISSNWFLGLDFHQFVTKIDNDLAGSTPSSLDLQTLETELYGGYNLLASEEFFGPKLQFMLGMLQTTASIQDSNPTAYTSNKYGGLSLGIGGSMPLSSETKLPITVGGRFMYYWNPTLSESPVNSGSSSSTNISSFVLNAQWQHTVRLAFKTELSFKQYNSSFSGSGSRSPSASSSSHAMTTLAGGVIFMF